MARRWWPVVTLAVASGAVAWAIGDYLRWLALGPGGLPATPVGWLTTTALRLRGGDRFHVRGAAGPSGTLSPDIPARSAPRSRVGAHPIPHRVLDQHPGDDLLVALQDVLDQLVDQRSSTVEYRTSHWESHHDALWLRHHADDDPAGEIAHLHPDDGSMHVVLGVADAQLVVDQGWGELHPLAGRAGLPATYVLLYPPVSRHDVDIIRLILAAALDSARRDDGS